MPTGEFGAGGDGDFSAVMMTDRHSELWLSCREKEIENVADAIVKL